MASKFNSTDRNLAQKEVERFFQTKLTPQKNFKKIFRDTNMYTYCILGGSKTPDSISNHYFSGLSEENFTFLQKETSKKTLIFAKKEDHKIILFSGNLEILINNKNFLVKAKDNSYKFNIKNYGKNVYIKEIQNFYLTKFSEIDIKINLLDKFKQLNPDQKAEIIEIISSQILNSENNKHQ